MEKYTKIGNNVVCRGTCIRHWTLDTWHFTYDNLHEGYIWLNGKSDKLTRHTDYFRVNYTVSPSSSLLWLMMTRHYRHGIWNLRKISQKSFNINYWGEGIKILENPYMGTSREVVGRCSCRDDTFFLNCSQDFRLKVFCSIFSPRNSWDQICEIYLFLKIKIVLDRKLNC